MAKRITLYGIFTCLALIFGYIESLFSLSFIAPGIKIGLANCLCLLLTARGDIRGALLVNITRVTLSALLFPHRSPCFSRFRQGLYQPLRRLRSRALRR